MTNTAKVVWGAVGAIGLLALLFGSGESVSTTSTSAPSRANSFREIKTPTETNQTLEVAPKATIVPTPTPTPIPQPTPKVVAPAAPATESCHPSYSGCLNPRASDYDCAGGSGNGPYYTGPVQVIGPDVFRLDRDGDGWGCE